MTQKADMNLINPSTGLYETYHLQTEPDMIYGWARQKSTAYAVGDVVRLSALDVSKKLVCVKEGTSGIGALTISSTAEGALVTDGSVTWIVDSFADGNYDAIHQNGIARGADLTAYWQSGHMSTNIRAGKFVGMHIGDYITKTVNLPAITYTDKSGVAQSQAAQTFTDVKWLAGAFDPHLNCGETKTTTHHVLIIPASTLQRNVIMNPTNTTEGGYLGSDMWRVHMPNWTTAIKNAFGSDHVLMHQELLTNTVNATATSGAGMGTTGTASATAWVNVEANIPNEQMVYGGRVFGSAADCGDFPCQLPLYALKCSHLSGVGWFWLRAVSSVSGFCAGGQKGEASNTRASNTSPNGGIRPYFLYY